MICLQMNTKSYNKMIENLFSKQFQSQINTPAVGAAYVIKRHIAQKSDNSYEEISLEVGELISIIEMPDQNDNNKIGLWRGKKVMINFSSQYHCKQFSAKVGFFPKECVQLIAKHSSHEHVFKQQSVDNDHNYGKIANFFRSLLIPRSHPISSSLPLTSSRRTLKHFRTVKQTVFGFDLQQYLINTTREIPLVLKSCAEFLELYGIVDGIYRLSGINSNIQRLRMAFDSDIVPDLMDYPIITDIHCVASLLKMYFRELPNPLLTFQLYDQFVNAINNNDSQQQTTIKLKLILSQMPRAHYRTLQYLLEHLSRVASKHSLTGMTPKNLAIVWSPNLLRSEHLESIGGTGCVEALHVIGTQAVLTEYLITFCKELFETESESEVLNTSTCSEHVHKQKHVTQTLTVLQQKLIEVGEGVNGLKQFHTHINIDVQTNSKSSPWRSLFQFSRSWSSNDHNKRLRRRLSNVTCASLSLQTNENTTESHACHDNDDTCDHNVDNTCHRLRHRFQFRSHSCDSYFTRKCDKNEDNNGRQSLCLTTMNGTTMQTRKRNIEELSSQSSSSSSISQQSRQHETSNNDNNESHVYVQIHNQMTDNDTENTCSSSSSISTSIPSLPIQREYEEQSYSLDFSCSETDPSSSISPSICQSLTQTPEQEIKTFNEIIYENIQTMNETNDEFKDIVVDNDSNDGSIDSTIQLSSCVRLLRSKFESNDNTINDEIQDNFNQPLIQNRRQIEKRERIDKYKNERRAQIRQQMIDNTMTSQSTQQRVPPIPAPRRINNNYQHITARVDTRWHNNTNTIVTPIVTPRRLSLDDKKSLDESACGRVGDTCVISVRPLAKPSQQNNTRISALFMH